MNDRPATTKAVRFTRKRCFFGTICVAAFGLAVVIAVVPLWQTQAQIISQFIALGLLQPIIAAFLAAAIVMGFRCTNGLYFNERRKDARSASNAVIAVRLWAICFVLLFFAMLLSSVALRSPGNPWNFTPAKTMSNKAAADNSKSNKAPQ
jgi:chromate transport protein ChrA